MGYLSAYSVARTTSLEVAIGYHLTSNVYPPVPGYMVEPAAAAVRAGVAGAWDSEIKLPEQVTFRGRSTATAAEIIDSLRLDAFIDAILDEDDLEGSDA